jgi:hypothetical protein
MEQSPSGRADTRSASQECPPHVLRPKGSLSYSQDSTNDPYPQPHEISSYSYALFL